MAVFIPPIEKILQFKVKPTQGELYLLQFLEKTLDDSFEIYFNPYMNGDRPDVVIMRKNYGVLIIEVKDWDLSLYELDDKKHWKLKTDKNAYPQSPINQVLKYKDNLFELHIENLLEKKIKDFRNFKIVACAVYFHNANEQQITDFLVSPFSKDKKYQIFLKNNIDLIGRNNLNESDFEKLLKKRYLVASKESSLFKEDLYNSFKHFMSPPRHMKEDGENLVYTPEQEKIIYGDKKQQRIKGVFGSGKTIVLAARAVQAYKRLSITNPNAKILILTYNITLTNYIHDKISKIRENFPWDAFIISNYHLFINSQLNNLGIPFEEDKCADSERLDLYYYSNIELFKAHKSHIEPFDAIFIDEIQDFKKEWMEIIKECFLAEDGEYVLFGDAKQNTYNNSHIEQKDVCTNVQDVAELTQCFRSGFDLINFAIRYQKKLFCGKYEYDTLTKNDNHQEIKCESGQNGSIIYEYLLNQDFLKTIYEKIHKIIKNDFNNISPNDITIIGFNIDFLRCFDLYYRYASGEKTTTTFETYEVMYLNGLKEFGRNNPKWISDGLELLKPAASRRYSRLAMLLTIYSLSKTYPEVDIFQVKKEIYFKEYNVSINEFENYIDSYREEFEEFEDFVVEYNYEDFRRNKKVHFWMNSGTIKISTIQSFKGYESELLFLIIDSSECTDYKIPFDELLYTGITRCRSNLVIINIGNDDYDKYLNILMNNHSN